MFTGIVDHCGIINQVDYFNSDYRIVIDSQFNELSIGESIAVSGICLTVTECNAGQFTCDVSAETRAVTTVATWQPNTRVNLERALRASDRLGGHYVMGHVDHKCELLAKIASDTCYEFRFAGFMPEQKAYLVPKGSVTVNGISLTINQVTPDYFSVMVIPHTLERTDLADVNKGDQVNVEFDYMARTIVNYLQTTTGCCHPQEVK